MLPAAAAFAPGRLGMADTGMVQDSAMVRLGHSMIWSGALLLGAPALMAVLVVVTVWRIRRAGRRPEEGGGGGGSGDGR